VSIFFNAHRNLTKPDRCSVCGEPIPEGIPFWRVFREPYCLSCNHGLEVRASKEDEPGGDQSVRWFKSA